MGSEFREFHPAPRSAVAADRSGLQALNEAKDVGLATAAALDAQGEELAAAENCVDSNQYIINKSGRIVRGMTWWGWITNTFTAAPKPPDPQRRRPSTHAMPPTAAVRPTATAPPQAQEERSSHPQLREQQDYLDEVSLGLDELREVGVEIGRRVETQNEAVPRLHEKMDALWQSTRHVTRQAGRVIESYATRATPKLLGHVALRDVATRRFVQARGDEVGLSKEVDCLRATCRFALYEKRAHLLGLYSPVSQRYVGLTFAGNIRCSARTFGRTEEFDLDLQRPAASPVLCVAANFGAGCWLRVEPREGRLLPAESRSAPDALQRAARFEVLFLDQAYRTPSYAEEILVPVKGSRVEDT